MKEIYYLIRLKDNLDELIVMGYLSDKESARASSKLYNEIYERG